MDDIISRGAKAENIRIVSIVCAPPAMVKLSEKYRGVVVAAFAQAVGFFSWGAETLSAHVCAGLRGYTSMIDPEVDSRGYIIPGLGDAGDRAFGTAK